MEQVESQYERDKEEAELEHQKFLKKISRG